jgi:hypothetical protein
VASLAVGQSVEIAFNAPRPDLRVPDQANGRYPGRGEYQTRPDRGVILGALEGGAYLVEVELSREFERNGRKQVAKSYRKRIVPESKLTAV